MKQDRELLQEMYYVMKNIRRFEEASERLYKRGVITGTRIHLYAGMETTAARICLALRRDAGGLPDNVCHPLGRSSRS
jgi:TPP-dependent pyruvate/acetoin dehydrogenase alpha subunit